MFATTEQVAEFYEVDRGTVQGLVKYHRAEFQAHGYRSVSGPELRVLKLEVEDITLKARRSLATWDRQAVLLLGMLLRDSVVAKAVRRYLLLVEQQFHEAVTVAGNPDLPVALPPPE